jgi:hypothetical protein
VPRSKQPRRCQAAEETSAPGGRAYRGGGVFSYPQGECVSRFEIEGFAFAVEIYFVLDQILVFATPTPAARRALTTAVLEDRRRSLSLAPYPQRVSAIPACS